MESIRQAIQGFSNAKVLCLGDIMLDRFVYGQVDRISPEAPVPVFNVQRQIQMLGGCGNVIRNIASLGGTIHLMSVVGEDTTAQIIREECARIPKLSADLIVDKGRKTTLKTRFVSAGHQMLRADEESVLALTTKIEDEVFKAFEKVVGDYQAVILSDYGKGFFYGSLTKKILKICKDLGIPTVVDPKDSDFSKYAHAYIMTPNFKEFKAGTGKSPNTEKDIFECVQDLQSSCKIDNFLVTRSQDGMSLYAKDSDPVHIPTHAQEVFDVSGAGDTVVATLALGIACQTDLETASKIANLAAGLVVAKIGTATVSQNELYQALDQYEKSAPDALGLVTWNRAQERVLEWHRKGLRVGFTNGCFDILHTGHLSLLRQSKSQCDRLIIALNSDASVKRLKGDARPVNAQEDRAQLLLALNVVDMVVIFDQDTPLELLQYLKPDVLIKGSDYTLDQVVGSREIQAWGGKVVLADLVPGQSTTQILKRAS